MFTDPVSTPAQEIIRAASESWLGIGNSIGRTFSNIERGLHGWSERAEAAVKIASLRDPESSSGPAPIAGEEGKGSTMDAVWPSIAENSPLDSDGHIPRMSPEDGGGESGFAETSFSSSSVASTMCDGGVLVTRGEVVDELMHDDGGAYSHGANRTDKANTKSDSRVYLLQ